MSGPGGHPNLTELLTLVESVVGDGTQAGEMDAAALAEIRSRLAAGRFHLAVLGQFKRGKSTLINALLGQPLLPTAVLPATGIPTYLSYGKDIRISIGFKERTEEYDCRNISQASEILGRYVTEESNPKNRKGVLSATAYLPSPLLADGAALIDTPGIGSTHRHNTETARQFLAHCDAAVFVVSADPPITEAEIEFLRSVADRVPRLFFAINKADYLTPEEQAQSAEFLRQVVSQQAGLADPGQIFIVSARQGLAARMEDDREAWRQSGLASLEDHLKSFLASDKTSALEAAVRLRGREIVDRTLLRLRLRRRALEMSRHQLEERLSSFDRILARAEREKMTISDLLAGDRRRTVDNLEAWAEGTRSDFISLLNTSLPPADGREEGTAVTGEPSDLSEMVPDFFEERFQLISGKVEAMVHEIASVHQKRIQELTEMVQRAASELFDISYIRSAWVSSEVAFEDPYWVTNIWDSAIGPVAIGWLERLLPGPLRAKRLKQRRQEKITALAVRNTENLRWSLLQKVNHVFRLLESELQRSLREAVAATKGEIAEVMERKRRSQEETTAEMEDLEDRIQFLEKAGDGLVEKGRDDSGG